jgi:hypothetical protein
MYGGVKSDKDVLYFSSKWHAALLGDLAVEQAFPEEATRHAAARPGKAALRRGSKSPIYGGASLNDPFGEFQKTKYSKFIAMRSWLGGFEIWEA